MVIAGAGVSVLAPTSLPGWSEFNEAVLGSLARQLASATSRRFTEERLRRLLRTRGRVRAFTPDFMAQLMEEEAGASYFNVLRALDANDIKENHAALATLAA